MSAETIRLIKDGESRREKKEIIYLSLYCHNQKVSRIKMGSDERLFYVSLNVRDKVARQCPQTTNLFEETGQPKRNRAETLLLTSLTAGPNRLTRNHISNKTCCFTSTEVRLLIRDGEWGGGVGRGVVSGSSTQSGP